MNKALASNGAKMGRAAKLTEIRFDSDCIVNGEEIKAGTVFQFGERMPRVPPSPEFDVAVFEAAAQRIRQSMIGYWITDRGNFIVTFYRPSRWERFLMWFDGWHWVDY